MEPVRVGAKRKEEAQSDEKQHKVLQLKEKWHIKATFMLMNYTARK